MSTGCPWTLALGSEGPRGRRAFPGDSCSVPMPAGRPAVPGHSRLGPRARGVEQLFSSDLGPGSRARGVDQHSRLNRALVQGPVGSTICSGELGPESKELRSRPAFPGDVNPFWRASVFDQLSREPRDLVRGPAVLTSLPGRLRPVPEGPRCPPAVPGDSDHSRGPGCRTAVPGDSRMCPMSPGVNQGSLASWARVEVSRG